MKSGMVTFHQGYPPWVWEHPGILGQVLFDMHMSMGEKH